jgi:hypothetical protein
LLVAPFFLREKPTVLVMLVPASVFLRGRGRTGGEDMGGDRIGAWAGAKRGARGALSSELSTTAACSLGALVTVSGVRAGEPTTTSGGVCGSGEVSKPGGLDVGEASISESGANMARAEMAASVVGTRGKRRMTCCPG